MSEIGEIYKAAKELRAQESTERRHSNLNWSVAYLQEKNISFEKKSKYHYVVTHNGLTADFWPSTGKFKIRFKDQVGRGVKNLINLLTPSKGVNDSE